MLNNLQITNCSDILAQNPHQNAILNNFDGEIRYEKLNGANLTYQDIINSSLALEVVSEFFDFAAFCAVKNSSLSCVSLGATTTIAFDKALDSNPVGLFNSTIATTKIITLEDAIKINSIKPQIVLSVDFEPSALIELQKNRQAKILKINTPFVEILKAPMDDFKMTSFGLLQQTKDTQDFNMETFKVLSKKKPQQEEMEDMIFAYKIVKHIPSCAAVVASSLRTLGICGYQEDETFSLEFATIKVCDSLKDSVVALDNVLTSKETINIAIQNRARGIIQAGIVEDELIKLCDKHEITLISAGIGHIK